MESHVEKPILCFDMSMIAVYMLIFGVAFWPHLREQLVILSLQNLERFDLWLYCSPWHSGKTQSKWICFQLWSKPAKASLRFLFFFSVQDCFD